MKEQNQNDVARMLLVLAIIALAIILTGCEERPNPKTWVCSVTYETTTGEIQQHQVVFEGKDIDKPQFSISFTVTNFWGSKPRPEPVLIFCGYKDIIQCSEQVYGVRRIIKQEINEN